MSNAWKNGPGDPPGGKAAPQGGRMDHRMQNRPGGAALRDSVPPGRPVYYVRS